MFRFLSELRSRAAPIAIAAGVAAAALLGGCGGGGSSTPASTSGTLRLALTDAPACGYDAVNVTVEKVRIHQSGSAGDGDAGWSEIVLTPAKRIDLLSLTNGVLAELGQTALPAGKYTQMRLVLAANGATTPLANSIVPSGGAEIPLTTPSAQQSGLKMNVDIDIAADQLADFVLDFDACKSIVVAGASGRYLLKPVVRVIPRYVSGVQGYVDPSLAGDTAASLQQNGVVVKASVPDAAGRFLLAPVAAGSYDLVIATAGHATAVVTGVAIAADTVVSVNTAATPFAPPASASGTAAGTVTTGVTPVEASVRVVQTLAGGRVIVIADANVDADTGAYAYALPVAAPVVASFAPLPGVLAFAADASAAGKYTLQAGSGGAVKPAMPITLSPGSTVTTNFTFP